MRTARATRPDAGKTRGRDGALFARQGVDNTRINQITDEADVGFGSFYRHFSSKEEIIAAVLRETIAGHGAAVHNLSATLQDPPEMVAVAHPTLPRSREPIPTARGLLIRLEPQHRVLATALREYATRDIELGIASGR